MTIPKGSLTSCVSSFDEAEVDVVYKEYIDILHRYNEAKDVGQMLMGKLGTIAAFCQCQSVLAKEGKICGCGCGCGLVCRCAAV